MSFIPLFRATALAASFAAAVTVAPGGAAAQTAPPAASPQMAPPAASTQTAPPAASASKSKSARARSAAGGRSVEARIKSLHDQLKITAAEEQQWNAVAQAMRDSAKNTSALIADRAKNTKSRTAIDDLHSYRAVLKSHLDGIDALTTAFEALYTAMPDAQKKIADAVFSRRPSRAARPKSG
jgi:hypothetical protein